MNVGKPPGPASPGRDPGREPSVPQKPPGPLSHVAKGADGRERARMVDVGPKQITDRSALARARVVFPPGLLAPLLAGGGPKGPIEEVARVAGILAAKRTAELIPMCHPLGLDHVQLDLEAEGDALVILCRASCRGRTGIEMEALTGAAIAALTVIDMAKALTPELRIEGVELLEKSGGRRGHWRSPRA